MNTSAPVNSWGVGLSHCCSSIQVFTNTNIYYKLWNSGGLNLAVHEHIWNHLDFKEWLLKHNTAAVLSCTETSNCRVMLSVHHPPSHDILMILTLILVTTHEMGKSSNKISHLCFGHSVIFLIIWEITMSVHAEYIIINNYVTTMVSKALFVVGCL